jgi:tetratricopeptide (TPR) repeat protein
LAPWNVDTGTCSPESVRAIVRERGDRHDESRFLNNLGIVYALLGELPKAISYYEQALTIARAIGDRRSESYALGNLGNIYTDLGETRRAIDACEESLVIARAIGERRMEGYALSYLARAQVIQGDTAWASATYTQARTVLQQVRDRWGEGDIASPASSRARSVVSTSACSASPIVESPIAHLSPLPYPPHHSDRAEPQRGALNDSDHHSSTMPPTMTSADNRRGAAGMSVANGKLLQRSQNDPGRTSALRHTTAWKLEQRG